MTLANLLRLRVAAVLALCTAAASPSFALPAFARQTGSECSACHVGGVGPHLTPHGIRFKLSGYTDGDKDTLPLSAQVRVSHNELQLPSTNSANRLDEASVYLAGRLAPKIGAYLKVMHSDDPFNSGAARNTELHNVDIRYADTARAGDRELLWGLSLNNNPGVQDPLDANQAWGFPALGTTGSLFNGTTSPTVPRRVAGLTAYGLWDQHWYAEAGAYRSFSRSLQDKLGQDPQNDPGQFSGLAPYWRLAYLHDMKTQFFGGGLYGMGAKRQLTVTNPMPHTTERSGAYDTLSDIGVDAMYEYLGNRQHIVQLRASVVRERRRYGSTPVNPYTGQVAPARATVHESTLAGTYVFQQSYGLTAAVMRNNSQDPVRYYPFGRTDSKVRYAELFWTPFGKEDSWAAPWANLRLAAAWARFDKFNGGTKNIFGPYSPDARNLDSFQVYAQVTF